MRNHCRYYCIVVVMHAKGNDPYEQRQNGVFSELVVLVVKENRALSDADEYRTYIYI